jgi:RHS repeat-associated protein
LLPTRSALSPRLHWRNRRRVRRVASGRSFAYNLRFSGQVFDGQAGLHYNGFRDFDPAGGRYSESDPIGLIGGINTYAYVRSRPVMQSDHTGLDAYVVVGGDRSDSWNLFGHASIAVTGGGLYSFGTNTLCGASVADFLQSQAEVRHQTAFLIKTSPAQDKQMLKYLQQFGQCKTVPLFPDNCSSRVENALEAGGVRLNDPYFGGDAAPFPASLMRSLLILSGAGGAEATDIPQGSPNIPDVSGFEKH